MASIDKRPNGKYLARWREYPGGPQKTKQFGRRADAQRFLDGVRGDLVRGVYIDPAVGLVTFRVYAEEWRQLQPHRASTATNVEQDLRLHVYPLLGDRPIASIRTSHVQAMVTAAATELKASTLHRVYGRVTAVFRAAVRDRIVASSPCVDVRLPRVDSAVTDVLTTAQVLDLAATVPDRYRALILTAAGTGLRPGELFGLAVDRVEFLRRTLKVDQQLVRVRGYGVALGALKTPSSYRSVPLPTTVAEGLAAHLEAWPAQPGLGLVFVNERGDAIQQQPFASMFETARRRAGLPHWATPHDLRHYYASLLIRSGASVKVVQARLGHASAKTTLDTYGHLWPGDDDLTRRAVDDELAHATPLDQAVTFRRAED